MAIRNKNYTDKQLVEMSLKAIAKNNLVFFEELEPYLPHCRATMYHRQLHRSDEIKKALHANRLNIKRDLRTRWYERENTPVTEIALYRLIGSDKEKASLAQKEYIVKEQDPEEMTISSKALEKLGKSKEGRKLLTQLADLLSDD